MLGGACVYMCGVHILEVVIVCVCSSQLVYERLLTLAPSFIIMERPAFGTDNAIVRGKIATDARIQLSLSLAILMYTWLSSLLRYTD